MRHKPVAIIDIDDTVGDMRTLMCDALNHFTGKDIHWTEWSRFRVEDFYKISFNEFFDVLTEYKVIENMLPHVNSTLLVDRLKDAGYHICFLTARSWHPNGRDITKEWLNVHGFHVDELMLCNVGESKSDILNSKFANIEFAVDDSVSHCREYVRNSRIKNVFVYDMPWNKCEILDNSHARRIQDLMEILDHMEVK